MSLPLTVREWCANVRPARRRGAVEFAEQEIILPSGPKRGMRYRSDFMPFASEILREYDRGRYQEFYLSGPAQSSKTLHGCIIPSMWHLFEWEEDVILGAPVVEMAQAAYIERILPAIEKSRYARHLPRHGGGSRGGRALRVAFGNGAALRFMGAGGGDQQRSSYTARVIVATELDKMDEAGKTSREGDPVSQLKARSSSFGGAARFYGECTMSTKAGRIYREVVELGTDSRVFLPCVHCKTWVWPDRSGLVGWQEAPDIIEARSKSAFQCPNCRKLWTEFDRQRAMGNPKIVSKGQTVDEAGAVQGEMPPTLTFGFRWNSMASPLLTMADIAADEWRAQQSGAAGDQKAVVQFKWAEPWEGEIADLNRLDVGGVLSKCTNLPRGQLRHGSRKLTLGVDVGKRIIWWTLYDWTDDAQGHLVDFGALDVPVDASGEPSEAMRLAALRAFRENVINAGWGGRRPDRILVDSGWEPDIVYQFVRESGQPRYLAVRGLGTTSRHGQWLRDPGASVPTEKRTVGNGYYSVLHPTGIHLVYVHTDHWKSAIHDGLFAAQGAPGAITLFQGGRADAHFRIFARQILAEERRVDEKEGKEVRIVWVVLSRQNHYLDCSAYARCGAEIEGVRAAVQPVKPRPPRSTGGQGGIPGIRAKY